MFSIYDILREADGDENQANNTPAADTNTDTETQTTKTEVEVKNDDNNDQQGDDPAGNDDFDMDMSLDGEDDTEGGEDTGTDDMGGGDMGTEEEPVEANTDMFGALSAEEQIMKISELKKQYAQLYNSCDDLIEKISNIENNENTLAPLSKLVNTLTDLKTYIIDYIYNQFDSKSFYENDVKLNFFLSIFYSISEVLSDIYRVNIQNQ